MGYVQKDGKAFVILKKKAQNAQTAFFSKKP